MRLPAARWLTAAVLAAAPAAAQVPGPLPAPGAVFQPLLADPKEPQFFAAFLWERSPRLAPRLGSVGFGQTIRVMNGRTWQVAIGAAGFSQFNLARPTADLMNPDYHFGLPAPSRPVGLPRAMPLSPQSPTQGAGALVHVNPN